MDNNRNLFITIALSIVILTAWQFLYINPRIEAQRQAQQVELDRQAAAQSGVAQAPAGDGSLPAPVAGADTVPGAAMPAAGASTREAAIAGQPRILIETPKLSGTLNLQGARFDDILLNEYRVEVDPASPKVELLHPASMPNGYFAEVGFTGGADAGTLPGPDTLWTAPAGAKLTVETPVTLTHTNDRGLTFTRVIAIDADYLITVTDTVRNGGSAPVALNAYGRVTRFDKPTTPSNFVLHEGLIGVTGEEGLQEIDYSTLEDDKEVRPGKSTDGWLGITDKYWATALIPPSGAFQPRYSYFEGDRPRFQADYLSDAVSVAAGGEASFTSRIFAGAKVVSVIDRYEAEQDIRQFELMIDWGWFYFITKPMFHLMDWLYRLAGNFGVAILLTTVVVKLIFFPLANKSYVSMARMKVVQPKMLEIREKYADDKMKQQQMMMELYKKEKINPIAGCWPVLVQIPVFFALYKVLYVTIEMRHAPFFGWIQDLAAPDPTSLFNLFGLIPVDLPQVLTIGVWPLLMGITMFIQMQMNPPPPDPTQALIFKWMPIVFTFMMAAFPAGLIIYWAWNNLLSILQQGFIMKRQGAKIELWDNLKGLFSKGAPPAGKT
ncbi:MAG: membrane protein insertase YidC [Rhizobiaceae bacterium]|jgi:YidC/Oxa1 family membrane protein insertase|nr:membrane protein insertase YidC [Rhizobiaceae bacterium]